MTKREIRRKGYTAIVKEGKSHQETYESLKVSAGSQHEEIALELSKIPTATKRQKYTALITIYIVLLAALALLRVFSLYLLLEEKAAPIVLGIALIVGLLIPFMGIYGAVTGRFNLVQSTSIVLIVSIVQSFRVITKNPDIYVLLGLVPVVLVILLGFYLANIMKTKYTSEVITDSTANQNNKRLSIKFEGEQQNYLRNDDLLDV